MKLSQKTIATRTLLIQLIKRGWSFGDLAEKCGVDQRYIENQASCNFRCERARLLVEQVFGIPIFSSVEEFAHAAELTKLFGFDPRLAKISQLQTLAKERGLTAPTNFRKPRLIETLAAQLAAPQTNRKKTHHAAENPHRAD